MTASGRQLKTISCVLGDLPGLHTVVGWAGTMQPFARSRNYLHGTLPARMTDQPTMSRSNHWSVFRAYQMTRGAAA
jgi:hypothetical protein